MDIWNYFDQREALFESRLVTVRPRARNPSAYLAEPSSGDSRGIISADVVLTDDVYLKVFELVEVRGTGVVRLRYSYDLVINGAIAYQWHNDPKNHPEAPIHEHEPVGKTRARYTNTEPVSLEAVLDHVWDEATLQREAPLD